MASSFARRWGILVGTGLDRRQSFEGEKMLFEFQDDGLRLELLKLLFLT